MKATESSNGLIVAVTYNPWLELLVTCINSTGFTGTNKVIRSVPSTYEGSEAMLRGLT